MYCQDYNILSCFSYFRNPDHLASGAYKVNACFWLLFAGVFFVLIYSLIRRYSKNRLSWPVLFAFFPGALIFLFFRIPFPFYFQDLVFCEKNLLLFFAGFLLCYLHAYRKDSAWLYAGAALCAVLATFSKESVFFIFFSIAFVWLVFGWKNMSVKHRIFQFILLTDVIVFILLYYFLSYSKNTHLYNAGRFDGGYLAVVLTILRSNWFFAVAFLCGLIRAYRLLISRDRTHLFFDAILFSSLAFITTYFVLKLGETYYYLPIYILLLFTLFYWLLILRSNILFYVWIALALFASAEDYRYGH